MKMIRMDKKDSYDFNFDFDLIFYIRNMELYRRSGLLEPAT